MRTKTKYGPIFTSDGCKDDWPNLVNYRQRKTWQPVRLQRAAMRSFKAAERAFNWRTRRRLGRRPIRLTGSYRTCAFQAQQYASDRKRFAPPGVGVHTDGLAIDVHQEFHSAKELEVIRQVLRRRGWNQARADEPHHFSYVVTA